MIVAAGRLLICTDCSRGGNGSLIDIQRGGTFYVEPSEVEQHERMYHRTTMEGTRTMSAVLWCDPGDHAFKANVPGAQSATMTVRNEEGVPEQQQFDACPEHAFRPTAKPSVSPQLGSGDTEPA